MDFSIAVFRVETHIDNEEEDHFSSIPQSLDQFEIFIIYKVTWSPVLGLKMYVNQKLVSQTSDHEERITKIGKSRLYIGRANTNMTVEKFASAAFNQIQLCHGDRNSLAKLDIIHRGMM